MSKYTAATATFSRFIEGHGEVPEVGEAHYMRGLCHLKLRRRSEAARDFQAAIAKTSREELRVRAHAALAVMAYDDGDWQRAVRDYGQAVTWLSELQGYDEHLLRYGISMQRLGNWEQSAHLFSQVVHERPKGSAAKTARIMLGWNHTYFTVQCHALGKSASAAKEVARLRSLGLEAEQKLETRTGKALYLIHVGRYPTYDLALKALQRVKQTARIPAAKVVP